MQDLSKSLILLKGELKTLQIDHIEEAGATDFRVFFKDNPKKPYTYSAANVVWLTNPQDFVPELYQVYRDGQLQTDVTEILHFQAKQNIFWRIKYRSGYECEYTEGQINIVKTCLDEETSKNTFAYFKQVAAINPLRKEDENNSILSQIYDKVDFIDEKTAAACYINPDKYKTKKLSHKGLIYPFGCNASQKKAVASAFEHQISIIQGPPGTGKTQTILNILANIMYTGMTAIVVSSNNSAIENVYDKLQKEGLGFILARLGNRENFTAFFENQPSIPEELNDWGITNELKKEKRDNLDKTLQSLDEVYEETNKDAHLRQEQMELNTEWEYFCKYHKIDKEVQPKVTTCSNRVMSLLYYYEKKAQGEFNIDKGILYKFRIWFKSLWMSFICKHLYNLRNEYEAYINGEPDALIIELKKLFYLNRKIEIAKEIKKNKSLLSSLNAGALTNEMIDVSKSLLKDSIYTRFKEYISSHKGQKENQIFCSKKYIEDNIDDFRKRYPIVTSTTFSSRKCLFGEKYDYVIMDEASQVSIEQGFLALTCASNAVIVGDPRQLPNVVQNEDLEKLTEIWRGCKINDYYNCAKYSFLNSIMRILNIKDGTITMLKEHYRCHPRIINFCNQKFYGGELIIMTEDKGEENVICAELTPKGNHATVKIVNGKTSIQNIREWDVINKEIIPNCSTSDICILTPYNGQVDMLKEKTKGIGGIQASTIHKSQGREMDTIIVSLVANTINDFIDNKNLLNVAISRAKKKICLVMTGNILNENSNDSDSSTTSDDDNTANLSIPLKEEVKGSNIADLLYYIIYNNCTITKSKIKSIFDILYKQYDKERANFLKKLPIVSEFDSENVTYNLIQTVINDEISESEVKKAIFSRMRVTLHVPLNEIFQDMSELNTDELKFATNPYTHVDFLIYDSLTKRPLGAIETDGYSYHNEQTEQIQRDSKKDKIFKIQGLPLLRLSTKESQEEEKVRQFLEKCVDGEKRWFRNNEFMISDIY